MIWAKSAGGTKKDIPNSIASDNNGNLYVTGFFYSSEITFGSTLLKNKGVFLAKYNSSGNILWAKGAESGGIGNAVATDQAGNVYIGGKFYTSSIRFDSIILTHYSMFLVKYNAYGNVVWAKDARNGLSINSIAPDNFGNIYVTGSFADTLILGKDTLIWPLYGSQFIAKYDTAGNPIWAKQFNADGYLSPCVATDKYGNAYITGDYLPGQITIGTYTLKNKGDHNIYVAKFDPAGKVLWAKSYGDYGDDEGTSIATDTSGNFYICGHYSSPRLTFGSTVLEFSGTGSIFLVKSDPNGNVIWAKRVPGDNIPYTNSPTLAADKPGNVYLAGYFNSPSIVFDSADSLVNRGLFLAKYDSNGNFKWARDAIGTGSNPTSVTIDQQGNPYICGYFGSQTIQFDSNVLNNDTAIWQDIFIASIGTLTGIEDISKLWEKILIYPNPSDGKFTIQMNELPEINSTLEIYNLLGEKIYSRPLDQQSLIKMDISTQPEGIYFIKVQSADKVYTEKVVVQ